MMNTRLVFELFLDRASAPGAKRFVYIAQPDKAALRRAFWAHDEQRALVIVPSELLHASIRAHIVLKSQLAAEFS
jgi:hypothetical protein